VDPEEFDLLKQGDVEAWNQRNMSASVDLRDAQLPAANLAGIILVRAYMASANLTRAELSRAFLRHIDLRGAILEGTDLAGADLRNSDLSGVQASNACFRKADLRCATFTGGSLRHADIGRALIGETNFIDVDLSTVRGLETCVHEGPSTLDHRTLTQSRSLPRSFLQGCGLPDVFIEYLPPLFWENPLEFYSCFISYSHADKKFACKLHDVLQGRGVRCWLDEKKMLPGDDIYDKVDRGLRLSDKVLLCCSEASLRESWWVDNEIRIALAKEREAHQKRGEHRRAIVPLNLDGFLFTDGWESGYREQILSRLAADFTGWQTNEGKFEHEIEKLVRTLRANEVKQRSAGS
jgi:hypothetical protein